MTTITLLTWAKACMCVRVFGFQKKPGEKKFSVENQQCREDHALLLQNKSHLQIWQV